MIKIIPSLMKSINLQIQEIHQTLSTNNMKKTMPMCNKIKVSETYEKHNIIKASREKKDSMSKRSKDKDASRILGDYISKKTAGQHL